MALDDTDKRLVNGLIWFACIGVVAYFLPWVGYQKSAIDETDARAKLETTSANWVRFYPQMHPANLGHSSSETPPEPVGLYLDELKQNYLDNNSELQRMIEEQKEKSKMNFPLSTKIPEDKKREPGLYFRSELSKVKEELLNRWRRNGVECMDDDIGFGNISKRVDIKEDKAEEYLRELHIAKQIINLCIDATVRERESEIKSGVKPEAFMRIVSVTPQESVPTGPSELLPNKNFKPGDEKTGKIKRYTKKFYDKFIQEYPVEIVLQCDVNTFMRLLHSVRAPGQFLIIRNLEIVSPYMEDSQYDKSELKTYDKQDEMARRMQLTEDRVQVRISAAGMDFFDVKEYPNGLYSSKAAPKPASGRTRQRQITGNTQAQ